MGLRLSWAAANGGRAVPVHVELAKKRNYYYYYIVVEGRGGKANLSRVFSPIAAKGKDMRGGGERERGRRPENAPLFSTQSSSNVEKTRGKKEKMEKGEKEFRSGKNFPLPLYFLPLPLLLCCFPFNDQSLLLPPLAAAAKKNAIHSV